MKRIVALIYKYYSFKKLPTPYFRCIMTLIGFLILHYTLVWGVLNFPEYLNPFAISQVTAMNFVFGGIFILLSYFIISALFKKKELDKYTFSENQLKTIGRYIVVYFFVLVLVLLISAILHKK